MNPDFLAAYRDKRCSAEVAAAMIPAGAKVALGIGAAQPPALLEALAARARAGQIEDVQLYYMLSTAVAARSVLDLALNDRLRPVSLFHSGVERALDKARRAGGQGPVDFIPAHFSQVPRVLVEDVAVDTLVTTVSPMDESGHFSFGTNPDYALPVARSGARVILEVNRHMPRVRGPGQVHVSRVAAIVEHDSPLTELPGVPLTPTDEAIGRRIAELVDDGACLQMGIGALPDAVCAALKNHRHLGIHTEMMTSGLAALVRAGVVDNSRKQIQPGIAVFAFALGDQPLYAFLADNPACEGHAVDFVNDPAVISRNDRVISVNATLEIDLYGACNSEFVRGRQFSATGGQVDFVRGAYASKGGRSIIACHATAVNGTVSRIVPQLSGPVTTSRADTHLVVTEFGTADLKGKTVRQRAQALIGLADPRFRDGLERSAWEAGLL
ncbi:MAG: acetyl-CoA hydrolase/transferase family protein [Zoogloeaceae bacterium]|nr:acetyl-CoA hydrolase/transferase family protein [Zoogloeaceae bacterium]